MVWTVNVLGVHVVLEMNVVDIVVAADGVVVAADVVVVVGGAAVLAAAAAVQLIVVRMNYLEWYRFWNYYSNLS